MARLILQHMAIGLCRHGDVTGFQSLLGHRKHLGGVFGTAVAVAASRRPPAAATKA